jgi:hypothetical protein
MCQTALAFLAILMTLTQGCIDSLADGINYLCDGNLGRRLRQPVATTRAANSGHQALFFQPCEQLFEIGQRYALCLGDIRQRYRTLIMMDGKIQHGGHCISPFG